MRAQWSKPDPDLACAAIAETQFSLIERSQALEAGMSPNAIKYRLATGRWKRLMPNVYLISGAAITWMTKAMSAVLWGGTESALAYRAAAHVWRFDGFGPGPIEICTNRRLRSNDVLVHRVSELVPRDKTKLQGIAVTSVHRTLIDLGDVCSPEAVEDALDGALRRRLTSAEWLSKELQRVGTHGRKGAATLKALLESGEVRPSWLERRFIRLLAKTEMPPHTREHPALDRYWIDFAWPGALLGVEVHGEKWHRRRMKWPKDLARHNALTAAGWTILHFTWAQIRDEPNVVISEVLSTYRRLAGLDL